MAEGHLPNLLIIGAAKSGTTSLHRYLSLHPDIFMSKNKELRYFVPREKHGRLHLGETWYRSNFPVDAKIRGESSPQYTVFPHIKGAPEEIKRVLGNPKLIYILRDPIERILSDYVQIVDEYYHRVPLSEMIPTITERLSYPYSRYHFQLTKYLELFPRENILVIFNERMNADPRGTLRRVFEFLDVDAEFWTADFDKRLNTVRTTKYIAPWFDRYAPEFLKRQLREPVLRSKAFRLYRALHWFSRIGGEPVLKPKLTMEEDLHLQALFKDDVMALRNLLSDPIPEWRAYG